MNYVLKNIIQDFREHFLIAYAQKKPLKLFCPSTPLDEKNGTTSVDEAGSIDIKLHNVSVIGKHHSVMYTTYIYLYLCWLGR